MKKISIKKLALVLISLAVCVLAVLAYGGNKHRKPMDENVWDNVDLDSVKVAQELDDQSEVTYFIVTINGQNYGMTKENYIKFLAFLEAQK